MQAQECLATGRHASLGRNIQVMHTQTSQSGHVLQVMGGPGVIGQPFETGVWRAQRVFTQRICGNPPGPEKGLKLQSRFGRQNAALNRGLVVQLAVLKQVQHRSGSPGARIGSPENHPFEPRVQYRAAAHGARLQRHKELAPVQPVVAQGQRRGAQGCDFSVRAGVVTPDGRVAAAGNQFPAFYDHRADGHLALGRSQPRLLQGQTHPVGIAVGDVAHAAGAPRPKWRIHAAMACSPGPPASYTSSMRACASGRC